METPTRNVNTLLSISYSKSWACSHLKNYNQTKINDAEGLPETQTILKLGLKYIVSVKQSLNSLKVTPCAW